jgi:hypothetical protein
MLARDRPAQSRQPGETLAAYRAFLAYLRSGSIRAAADALGKNRTTFERWSRRWRWPERRQRILAGVVRTQLDQLVYEMRYGLEAAEDAAELDERFWASFRAVTSPRIDRELKRTLKELREA